MGDAGAVRYGADVTVRSSYPWTLTRQPLRVEAGAAHLEFHLVLDAQALRSGLADTNDAAELGTESPTLIVDGELKPTSNLYCVADGGTMSYEAVFEPFPPVAKVHLRWHHRASGIDVDEVLHREDE